MHMPRVRLYPHCRDLRKKSATFHFESATAHDHLAIAIGHGGIDFEFYCTCIYRVVVCYCVHVQHLMLISFTRVVGVHLKLDALAFDACACSGRNQSAAAPNRPPPPATVQLMIMLMRP